MTSDDAQQIWDLAKAMADAEGDYRRAVLQSADWHIDESHTKLMKARHDCLEAINQAVEK